MKKNIVDIKCGRIFPFPFLVLGAAFVIGGIGVFITYPIISIPLIMLGVSILTAYEGTEVVPSSHTYREYNSFLFFKKGTRKNYSVIEKIFINSGKVTQKMYTAHTMNSSTFSSIEYNAYLKFCDGVKVFLFSDRNKARLVKKVSVIAEALDTSVVDHTLS